jgi:hypothetical protein
MLGIDGVFESIAVAPGRSLCVDIRPVISARHRANTRWWIWSGDAWCARCRTAHGFGRSSVPASPPWPIRGAVRPFHSITPAVHRSTADESSFRRASATRSSTPLKTDGSYSSGGQQGRTSASASWRSTRRADPRPRHGSTGYESEGSPVCSLHHSSSRPASSSLMKMTARSSLRALRAGAPSDASGAGLSSVAPGRHTARARPLISARRRARPGLRALARRAARTGTAGLPALRADLKQFQVPRFKATAPIPPLGMTLGRPPASFGASLSGRRWRGCSDGSRRPALTSSRC